MTRDPRPPSLIHEVVEIVIHGRGGQGAKTGGDILTYSLYEAGFAVVGQPKYGSDRMGAPVSYAIRFHRGGGAVHDRSWIRQPQYALVYDAKLIGNPKLKIAESLIDGGMLIVNSRRWPHEFSRLSRRPILAATVDASGISRDCGLFKGNVPILSTTMAGAFAAATDLIGLGTVLKVIRKVIKGYHKDVIDQNVTAARTAYEKVIYGA